MKKRPTQSEVRQYEKNKKKLQELDDKLYSLKASGSTDTKEFKNLKQERSAQFEKTNGYREGAWL